MKIEESPNPQRMSVVTESFLQNCTSPEINYKDAPINGMSPERKKIIRSNSNFMKAQDRSVNRSMRKRTQRINKFNSAQKISKKLIKNSNISKGK